MKKKFIYILSGLLFLTGCITNDIPYPVVVPHVDSFDVEGASKVEIDSDKQVITVYFAETTDIRNVQVNSITFRESEASLTEALVGYHDFTRQFKFTVKTYDEYVWTVKGVRDVERYFTVEGQIGASEIENEVYLVIRDTRRNLLHTAGTSGHKSIYIKSRSVGNITSGGVCCTKMVTAQNSAISDTELCHHFFFIVVCNNSYFHEFLRSLIMTKITCSFASNYTTIAPICQ